MNNPNPIPRQRARRYGVILTFVLTAGLSLMSTQARPRPIVERVAAMQSTAKVEVKLSASERQLVSLVNQERDKRGARKLTVDPILAEAAREHCREMAAKGYFDHFSPTKSLRTPADRYRRAAGSKAASVRVGENIYFCSYVSSSRAHRALMNSDGHRRNLLLKAWSRVGVGVYVSAKGEFWVTQMFSS